MRLRPHSLVVQSYRSPTFCHHCGEMLWGLVRQGLRCDGCGLDFHKRCAFLLPSNCSRARRQVSTSLSLFPPRRPRGHSLSHQAGGGSLEEISTTRPSSRPPSWAEPPVWLGVGGGVGGGVQVPHTFHIHSFTKPTVCRVCMRLLRGLFRQGLQCSDCRFNCHRRCEPQVPRACPGEKSHAHGEESSAAGHSGPPDPEDDEVISTPLVSDDDMSSDGDSPADTKEAEQGREPMSPCFSSNIPLMRLVQSLHHRKRRGGGGVLREGWLLHHTSTDAMRKRHYWILDRKCITLYPSESSTKYYKEIPLCEVLQVRGSAQLATPLAPGDHAHSFEVVTALLVYCVVAGEEGPAWEDAIHQGLMPVESRGGGGGGGSEEEEEAHSLCSRVFQDVSSVYQIFTDEVLGSGQFGVVYRGTHRKSGRPVAIKVIDKTRFPTKQETQLRNEVSILQNLSHNGVVVLERMFETVQYVFVVMEKLHGDMLEMILSNEKGRLPERNTRFLVVQILEALRYLHLKHIAHCDLKPENVLLASAEPLPQVKLCDFGYARLISEKSFRRTVVGTPAYLAPEVISSSGYNRSLDMWSVGVVMYVSLSGTFPFNEDEDIKQQITNASFMYPRQPWASVSLEAVSLINNLLRVSLRQRFSVGRALAHPWLQDFQLWCDLRAFEQRLGCRYLTHRGDEERWIRSARERGLDFPPHLLWEPDDDPDM
ncbi:protein kinase D4 [Limanda limanda]|uniref:protein kinase D4 n=1 Tax=Limanda limanda TaxID=27771 RepID=UPI0029C680E1|nr:protein kinase D4 [Limanda limanda]